MKIGGLMKCSLIDFPGKVCAIIFTQGCNFRCPFCHNPELVKPELFSKPIPEEEIISFLKKRIGKIEAVEVTGGEPLLQDDLEDFIKEVKGLGFLVKLDTNGSFPVKLEKMIKAGLLDYLAMDIKAPLDKYNSVAGVNVNLEDIKRSIKAIMCSNLDYQFRTTVVKALLDTEDLKRIGKLIKGSRRYVLQEFKHNNKILDESLLDKPEYSEDEIQKFQEIVTALI